mmetsp:Transcript_15550/g.33773  ORF Transcript_15550/g.33773 Transcript_15550/m.33773 type:complete len:108 (-) Transcript_15550:78-401(-)
MVWRAAASASFTTPFSALGGGLVPKNGREGHDEMLRLVRRAKSRTAGWVNARLYGKAAYISPIPEERGYPYSPSARRMASPSSSRTGSQSPRSKSKTLQKDHQRTSI